MFALFWWGDITIIIWLPLKYCNTERLAVVPYTVRDAKWVATLRVRDANSILEYSSFLFPHGHLLMKRLRYLFVQLIHFIKWEGSIDYFFPLLTHS